MKPAHLLAGAAVATLIAGTAATTFAATNSGAYAEPSQPVPYAQLGAYMKASPHKRMAIVSGADTGGAVNASAAMPAANTAPADQGNSGSNAVTPTNTPAPSDSTGTPANPAPTPQP